MVEVGPMKLTSKKYIQSGYPLQIYLQSFSHSIGLHWHEFYELSFVLEGEGVNKLNGTEKKLQPGSLFLSTPSDFHEVYPLPGSTMVVYNVVFSHSMLSEELQHLILRDTHAHSAIYAGEHFQTIEAEFRLLHREQTEGQPGMIIVARGALERILVTLFRSSLRSSLDSASTNPPSSYEAIHRAIVYVHHHFREPLTLKHAASAAQLSPNYFSEQFHKVAGVPFQKYLQTLRLQFAKSLLGSSDIPVSEICWASGFNTLTHFIRAFKQTYGMTPSQLRAAKRSGKMSPR